MLIGCIEDEWTPGTRQFSASLLTREVAVTS
jgi:hypothetical protein